MISDFARTQALLAPSVRVLRGCPLTVCICISQELVGQQKPGVTPNLWNQELHHWAQGTLPTRFWGPWTSRTRALAEGHPVPGHLTKRKGMDGMLLQPLVSLFFSVVVGMLVMMVVVGMPVIL